MQVCVENNLAWEKGRLHVDVLIEPSIKRNRQFQWLPRKWFGSHRHICQAKLEMYSSSVDNNPCTWRYNYNDECVKGYQVANSKCYVNYSDNAVSMMGQYQENSINNLSWSTPFDCVNNHNHHLNDSITTNQAYNNISALPPPSNEHVINLYDLCPDR